MSVRILAEAGYNPLAQSRMLSAVSKDMAFSMMLGRAAKDEQSDLQAWIDERITRVRDAASMLPLVADLEAHKVTHLAAVDGMDYGQPPSHGIVHGQTFFDSRRRYSFTLPEGFHFQRTTRPLRAVGPGGASIHLDSKRTRMRWMDAGRYLGQTGTRGQALRNVVRMSVNGMDAAMGVTSLSTEDGETDLRVVAIRASPRTIYRFRYMMPEGISAELEDPLWRTAHTFKRLSRREAAALKPYRLGLVTVQEGDTIDSVAQQMAFLDHPRLRFLNLNGFHVNERLIPGEIVKIVTE
jgi:predicted Zn-dependent protease